MMDEDELYELETMPASKRPEPFNELMSALVRLLFNLDNNEAMAYAMFVAAICLGMNPEKSLRPSAQVFTLSL